MKRSITLVATGNSAEKGMLSNTKQTRWHNHLDPMVRKSPWNESEELLCSAPTIAEVVMWLYEKHGDWISVVKFEKYSSCTFRHNCLFKEYNSPTEAYEAAIEYTLKNLI